MEKCWFLCVFGGGEEGRGRRRRGGRKDVCLERLDNSNKEDLLLYSQHLIVTILAHVTVICVFFFFSNCSPNCR